MVCPLRGGVVPCKKFMGLTPPPPPRCEGAHSPPGAEDFLAKKKSTKKTKIWLLTISADADFGLDNLISTAHAVVSLNTLYTKTHAEIRVFVMVTLSFPQWEKIW